MSTGAACKEPDKLYPLTAAEGGGCIKAATDSAMDQVRAAVAASEQGATPK
jgi:hypothetical protein